MSLVAWLLCIAAFAEDVRGTVVDRAGKPVAGVELATFWTFADPASSEPLARPMAGSAVLTSDENGTFAGTVSIPTLFAMNPDRTQGALVAVKNASSAEPMRVQLEPLVDVRGSFEVHAAGDAPKILGAWMMPLGLAPTLQCLSSSTQFRFRLPPGDYRLLYSTDQLGHWQQRQVDTPQLQVPAGQASLDLHTIRLDVPMVVTLAGEIVDAQGDPVEHASLASFWMADSGVMQPFAGASTDVDGRFAYPHEIFDLKQSYPLLALDDARSRAGFLAWRADALADPLQIELVPVIHVRGTFVVGDGKSKPAWSNTYVEKLPEGLRMAQCLTSKASFEFSLPPGQYRLTCYGQDTGDVERDVLLSGDQGDLDLGTITLSATKLAQTIGKEAPAWNITDARGLDKTTKLSDFKGKWVLLEFWGFW